jgi:hypothetical protein
MPETLHEIPVPFVGPDGLRYAVRVCGAERADGTWMAWLEFCPEIGPIRRTDRETSQPNRDATLYWATGLEAIYLEGAFARSYVAL